MDNGIVSRRSATTNVQNTLMAYYKNERRKTRRLNTCKSQNSVLCTWRINILFLRYILPIWSFWKDVPVPIAYNYQTIDSIHCIWFEFSSLRRMWHLVAMSWSSSSEQDNVHNRKACFVKISQNIFRKTL
jgi:hypothetical protein